MQEFDVIVIGAGPGGYVGAIRAAQLGFKTAIVDKTNAGGTCLNVGCIPSKALLNATHHYDQINRGHLAVMGIKANASMDIAGMMENKNKIVKGLTTGIEFLFKKNKIAYFKGTAQFANNNTIHITDGEHNGEQLQGKHIVIATGSSPASLPNIIIDEDRVVSSTGALAFDKVPEKLVVIGAGVIGLEMGSVWARLGSEVKIIEYLPRIAPNLDEQIARELQKNLQKQGLTFELGQKVLAVTAHKKGVKVDYEPANGGDKQTLECDKVLVSVGRKPNIDGLGLDKIGINTDKRGFIQVNDHYATNIAGIYAIGDVIGGAMLAHKAEEEGVALMEMLAGQSPHVNYGIIPGVIYTHPEVADVGINEETAKQQGIEYKVGTFPMMANSRARANGETAGLVKLISCAKSDKLLGAHIISNDAGALIHEAVLVMEYGGSAEDLARTCHAHPTTNEAVKEAALAVLGRAIHA